MFLVTSFLIPILRNIGKTIIYPTRCRFMCTARKSKLRLILVSCINVFMINCLVKVSVKRKKYYALL